MNNQFDELTKNVTQTVTRRGALKKFGLGLAVGCATLCLTAPVRAGEQVPFNGKFNPVILLVTPVDDSHVHLDLHVTARATHLGNAQGSASITLNVTDFTYVGHTTWAAANGDAVSFTFEGQFVPTATPGVLQNVETFEVVGGTGRFKGATGARVAAGFVDAGNGGGGTCDSGRPVFWVDPSTGTTTLMATTCRGDRVNRALSVDYRVDTLEALSFLNDVIRRVNTGEL